MITSQEIFTRRSWRNSNLKYLNKIWLLVKYFLSVVIQCWHIMCREYKLDCSNRCWQTCWIATLLRWWTSSALLVTNCWSFTIATAKTTPKTITHTYGDSLTFRPFSKTVHQHTSLTRWMSFWIARHLILCLHVAKCWYDKHFSSVNQIKFTIEAG